MQCGKGEEYRVTLRSIVWFKASHIDRIVRSRVGLREVPKFQVRMDCILGFQGSVFG